MQLSFPQGLMLLLESWTPTTTANTIIVRSDVTLPDNMNNQQLKMEVGKAKILKYVFTNTDCHPETAKKNIQMGKYDLTKIRRMRIALEHFNQIKAGGIYRLDSIEKIVRE